MFMGLFYLWEVGVSMGIFFRINEQSLMIVFLKDIFLKRLSELESYAIHRASDHQEILFLFQPADEKSLT